MTKNSYKLPAKMWGGFIDGRLDLDHYHEPGSKPYGILYRSRAEAKTRYDDVRRVCLMHSPRDMKALRR